MNVDRPTFRLPLRRLRNLRLVGKLRRLFRLLDRLSFPGTLDSMSLTVLDPAVEDVLQISGPYLRGYFRRDRWLQGRLGICSDYSISEWRSPPGDCFTRVNILGELRGGNTFRPSPVATFRVVLAEAAPRGVLGNLCLDLNAFPPGERVGRLETTIPASTNKTEGLLITMPNVETLILSNVVLSKGFLQPDPDGPHANTKLLPSLRSLVLKHIISLSDNDWGHLTTYLTHQISGGQPISLKVGSFFPHMCPEVAKELESLAGEFGCHDRRTKCPFGRCKGEWEDASPWLDYSPY